jgi:hypothetical protein
MSKNTVTINKITIPNEAILNPTLSTTMPPKIGPTKAPDDHTELNVPDIRPCVRKSFG